MVPSMSEASPGKHAAGTPSSRSAAAVISLCLHHEAATFTNASSSSGNRSAWSRRARPASMSSRRCTSRSPRWVTARPRSATARLGCAAAPAWLGSVPAPRAPAGPSGRQRPRWSRLAARLVLSNDWPSAAPSLSPCPPNARIYHVARGEVRPRTGHATTTNRRPSGPQAIAQQLGRKATGSKTATSGGCPPTTQRDHRPARRVNFQPGRIRSVVATLGQGERRWVARIWAGVRQPRVLRGGC
jgi:hypothetical protein